MNMFNRIKLLYRKLWWRCPKDTPLKSRFANVEYYIDTSKDSLNVYHAEIVISNSNGNSIFRIVKSEKDVYFKTLCSKEYFYRCLFNNLNTSLFSIRRDKDSLSVHSNFLIMVLKKIKKFVANGYVFEYKTGDWFDECTVDTIDDSFLLVEGGATYKVKDLSRLIKLFDVIDLNKDNLIAAFEWSLEQEHNKDCEYIQKHTVTYP